MIPAPSVDLHVHSVFSDGKCTPAELAERAAKRRVVALAITDHDTLAGGAEKLAACREFGVEGISGVEISCELDGREAHILSLFSDPETSCASRIEELSRRRFSRMEAMLLKLSRLGIHLAMEDLPAAGDGVYGRPHLARALVERGVVKNVNEAFKRYLYDGGPVHIDKTRLAAGEGIALAKEMGGVSVLAHPGVSGLLNDLDAFRGLGIDGVEVYHPKHGGETTARLLRYCGERGLLPSGGSDFHSPGDGPEVGAARTPVDVLEPLRRVASERK